MSLLAICFTFSVSYLFIILSKIVSFLIGRQGFMTVPMLGQQACATMSSFKQTVLVFTGSVKILCYNIYPSLCAAVQAQHTVLS